MKQTKQLPLWDLPSDSPQDSKSEDRSAASLKARKKKKKTKTKKTSAVTPDPVPSSIPVVASTSESAFSVSQLNSLIRGQVEDNFQEVWVKGEVSNCKWHSSGHVYFSLKDENSQINAVLFKGFAAQLKFRIETGMEVIVNGKITVYEPRGQYQIQCRRVEPLGDGALQIAFEQLKKRLAAEGLFEEEHKKELPALPQKIALVTSPTGAAVKDMIQVLSRRFKGLEIVVVPAVVQGKEAPASLVKGLQQANQIKDVDLVIVGRGGGSMEDLWGFNDEQVARAIFDSQKPVISAVGHEVDFTIADFVADLRAPTPSAAAELAVQNAADLFNRLEQFTQRLIRAQKNLLDRWRTHLLYLEGQLKDPQQIIEGFKEKLSYLTQTLKKGMSYSLESYQESLQNLVNLLESLSPLKVLGRGYSIVKKGETVISTAAAVKMGDQIDIHLHKGHLLAEVKKTKTTASLTTETKIKKED